MTKQDKIERLRTRLAECGITSQLDATIWLNANGLRQWSVWWLATWFIAERDAHLVFEALS